MAERFVEDNIGLHYVPEGDIASSVRLRSKGSRLFSALSAGTLLVAGCNGGGSPNNVLLPIEGSTSAAPLASATEDLSIHKPAIQTEMFENGYLSTPGHKETAIAQTADAIKRYGLEYFVGKGLSEKAVISAFSVSIFADKNHQEVQDGIMASGNFLWVNGEDGQRYLGYFTAGHLAGDIAQFNINEKSVLQFSRTSIFPTFGSVSFGTSEYGFAYFYSVYESSVHKGHLESGFDTAIIVISEELARERFAGIISFDELPTWSDLSFEPISTENKLSALCFPRQTFPDPHPVIGANLNLGEELYAEYQVVVDDALTASGCSGAIVYNELGQPVGSTVASISYKNNDPYIYRLGVDNMYVASFYNLSEVYARELLNNAITNLKSKTPK